MALLILEQPQRASPPICLLGRCSRALYAKNGFQTSSTDRLVCLAELGFSSLRDRSCATSGMLALAGVWSNSASIGGFTVTGCSWCESTCGKAEHAAGGAHWLLRPLPLLTYGADVVMSRMAPLLKMCSLLVIRCNDCRTDANLWRGRPCGHAHTSSGFGQQDIIRVSLRLGTYLAEKIQ